MPFRSPAAGCSSTIPAVGVCCCSTRRSQIRMWSPTRQVPRRTPTVAKAARSFDIMATPRCSSTSPRRPCRCPSSIHGPSWPMAASRSFGDVTFALTCRPTFLPSPSTRPVRTPRTMCGFSRRRSWMGRPVYDVIDRHGALVDRVQLPAFCTIAGFVIYMAVKDARGAVRLERARIY